MLTVLLMKMNESNVTHDNLRDLVGEVANTISGNVRRDFGKDFVISVPTVVSGHAQSIQLPPGCRPVVIPINWRTWAWCRCCCRPGPARRSSARWRSWCWAGSSPRPP